MLRERTKMKKGKRFTDSTRVKKQNKINLSLTEMYERFLLFKKSEGLSKQTLFDYDVHFKYLLDFLERDLMADEMTTEIFLEYRNYMLNDLGLKASTVNIRLRTIRAFLRYSYEEGWIDQPIHEKFKPVKAPQKEVDALSPREIKLLLSQINDDYYAGFRDKVLFFTMLDSMARISELLAIKRENVDLRNGVIKLEADGTKTKVDRFVPISTRTSKLLQEYINETSDFEQEILFLTYDGQVLSANTVRKSLMDYGKAAGINKQVSPHIWRHSGAILYIMNGGDPFSLKSILGHTTLHMTNHYVQMANTDVKKRHNQFSAIKSLFE
ncbi:tyrosine-type recombinase/integrase [Evansella cellulosilytica]|uniref:Integrase family protein n=1 Tax=Evansella cellulosilytica (strain ATCC 21833 / DSM 2522 / FERM P-1141 / JCM 9156 / N-4) TaxID=649639 RepID=E6U1M8_EVAC2|nr:tyrosine-type recombinase/integrase [Evansella cellulosilytica]ADU30391.1 integrase family protein [Evansella cellulosilytica DSM 2522]